MSLPKGPVRTEKTIYLCGGADNIFIHVKVEHETKPEGRRENQYSEGEIWYFAKLGDCSTGIIDSCDECYGDVELYRSTNTPDATKTPHLQHSLIEPVFATELICR
jgi:hypothetical protein